jgi:hypothetical protein
MTDISLSDCFDDPILGFNTPVEVRRFSAPRRDGGLAVSEPEIERFPADGSLQPMNAREAQNLSEGIRTRGAKKFYTECPLRTASASDCNLADQICDSDGVFWEVQSVDPWQDLGNYFKVIVARVTR